MTASTHSQYNYNRRNSSATPYTIPIKHQNQAGHVQRHGSLGNGQMCSASVPSLSREFVVRRISEGETGRLKEELKCEACGKGYKHISSLAKHLWEHTPEWNVTKKLLISKHQQVQLLEAASILVGMNENPSASRRNSVFHEETSVDDPKYVVPFSPSNSIDTKETSQTPTPPFQSLGNENNMHGITRKFKVPPPNFKNSFEQNVLNHEEVSAKLSNTSRTHSISQYPPSIDEERGLPSLVGGFLDTRKNSSFGFDPKSRSNSLLATAECDEYQDSKLERASYQRNPIDNEGSLNSPESKDEHLPKTNPHSATVLADEGIIGNME